MKKSLSTILSLCLLLSSCWWCLSGCQKLNPSNEDPADTTPAIVDTWFTGVLTADPQDGSVQIEVCEAYVAALGETVTAASDEWEQGVYREGDEVRMLIRAKDETVLRVSNIRLLVAGENNSISLQVPNLSELTVNEALGELLAAPLDNTWDKRQFDWYESVLRVVEIDNEKGIVYLARIFASKANYALIGLPEESVVPGDHLEIKVSKYYSHVSPYGQVAYEEDVTVLRILTEDEYLDAYRYSAVAEKPALYLYPETPTEVTVRLVTNGKLTSTYPAYGRDGWQEVMAYPDGTLIHEDREYYCLYWEASVDMEPDMTRGACVKGEDTAAYLEYALSALGLTAREANEFIIYWLPKLEQSPYNLITFQTEAYTSVVGLEITPAPDSLLRVCMVAKPLDAPVEIEEQAFEPFEREGFVAVEWGGVLMP